MKITANVILTYFIVFGLGVGVGWLLLKNDLQNAKDGGKNIAERATQFAVPEKTVSDSIPLWLAEDFRVNFRDFEQSANKPGTNCVVHDLKKLKEYIDSIDKKFAGFDFSTICRDSKLGIALYLGKSYDGDFLQNNNGKLSFIKRNEFTVFMLPVVFSEVKKDMEFRYVYNVQRDVITDYEKHTVDGLGCFHTPLNYYGPNAVPKDLLYYRFKDILNDPQGFDLGHTHP
jgi:hypothetical protein